MNRIFGGLLCAFFLAGCAGDSPPEPPPAQAPPPPQAEALYFEPIAQGIRADLADTTEIVFRDARAWADFARRLHPTEPIPNVDFSQVMVLVAALPAPSSGYEVSFIGVERIGTEVQALYVYSEPDGDCITGQVTTVPFQAVQIPRTDEPIRFTREHAEYSCGVRQRS